MQYVFLFTALLIFGLCCGSFLNCVIYRLENKKSFARGRSFCPKCKHKLGFWDLIPIISFLILQGKCRYCKKKISVQYPLAEISTGLIFLLIFNFQFSIFKEFSIHQFSNLIYLLVVACLLEIIFIYDLKHYIIPDKVVYPAIGLVLLYQIFGNLSGFLNHFLSAVALAGFFFLIWLASRGKWLGFGDVKLGFLLGLFLGFPAVLTGFLFAFWLGSAVGLVLIALKKKKMKSEVPFGPFLIAGAFIGLFWGERVISWYLNILSS